MPIGGLSAVRSAGEWAEKGGAEVIRAFRKDSSIPTNYAIRLHDWKRQNPHRLPSECRRGTFEFEMEGQGEAAAFFFLLDISGAAKRAGIVELFVRNVGVLMDELKK